MRRGGPLYNCDMALPHSYTRMQLPVHADAYGGFGDIRGLLSFDGRQLRLAWQTSDSVFGVLKSGPQEIDLPLVAIERVSSGLGWFWSLPYLELEFNDFALAARMPGANSHTARLRVRFRDRRALRRLVDAVNHARAQGTHAALSAELEAGISAIAPELPPPQPLAPVQSATEPQSATLPPVKPRQTEG